MSHSPSIISIIQTIIQKPEHYPVYQALSIIQLSSIQGIIHDPKQHPISTPLSPIPSMALKAGLEIEATRRAIE